MSTSTPLAPPSSSATTKTRGGHPDFELEQTSVEPPHAADAAGAQAFFEPAPGGAAGGHERTGHVPENSTVANRKIPGDIKQVGGRSATERDEFLRAAWRVMVIEVDPERLVFVDEMGVHTSLAPLYGYSPKGERVRLKVPRNRGKNTTILASMTLGGMGETMAVEGSTDQEVFEAYVEHVLAPTLEAGQLVTMDNLSAHKPARVRELIESRGCELLYLPAYSPDFNPIEEAFSKIKGMLRQAGTRTKDALIDVLGEALSAVSAQDARGYFQHAGYRPQAQLL
jgi:transposase